MGRGKGRSAAVMAVGAAIALVLAGCSQGDGENSDGSAKAAGPSPSRTGDDRLCPFLTLDEQDELSLRTHSPVPKDDERAERKRERDRKARVVEECAYIGPLTGGGPLQQLRMRLREGDVAELGAQPGYRPRPNAQRNGIAFERGIAFNGTTAVCILLAPGRAATDGKSATTVELMAFVPVRTTKGFEHGDSCAAMNDAAPLLEKKFRTS
ncbi:hypothetical protein [Streptomyces sp. NPDC006267]|uniref:hypothetical protein n=1 Tax=unclassified Streptomyces TaxID=2593676 RepID=UPI00339F0157